MQLLFGAAIVLGVSRLVGLVRTGAWPPAATLLPRAVPVFAVLFPLAYLLYKDPTLYDGMRHYLFILPPMVCAWLRWPWSACYEGPKSQWSKRTRELPDCKRAWESSRALCRERGDGRIAPLSVCLFQSDISGGLPAAYMRDETDYWGISHKEAAEWLNDYVERDRSQLERRVFRVHQPSFALDACGRRFEPRAV